MGRSWGIWDKEGDVCLERGMWATAGDTAGDSIGVQLGDVGGDIGGHSGSLGRCSRGQGVGTRMGLERGTWVTERDIPQGTGGTMGDVRRSLGGLTEWGDGVGKPARGTPPG